MRVYHKHLHEYASVVRKVGDSYLVQYDGDTQIYEAKASFFDVVEQSEVPYWYDDFAMHCEGHI